MKFDLGKVQKMLKSTGEGRTEEGLRSSGTHLFYTFKGVRYGKKKRISPKNDNSTDIIVASTAVTIANRKYLKTDFF